MNRLPFWFKQDFPSAETLGVSRDLSVSRVHTVCQEALCPNLNACLKRSAVTFMILGDACTRSCRFCGVKKIQDRPLALDWDEPYRIQDAVRKLNLGYVVITAVTRDDLADGGAEIFARAVQLIHEIDDKIKIELLIPDFQGNLASLKSILAFEPDVVAHNMETVERIYPELRPQSSYLLSLNVLKNIKQLRLDIITKSSLMLGLGEGIREAVVAMQDLRKSRVDILTLGQYLAPSPSHYPVREFIHPEQFEKYRVIAMELGFKAVLSGPLVRSSYRAEEVYNELRYDCLMTNEKIQSTK